MHGRRREARFLMSPPESGAVQTPQNVTVERIAEKDIWVLSLSPVTRDDALILEMPESGNTTEMKVRVAENRPVVEDDRLQQGVQLDVENDGEG